MSIFKSEYERCLNSMFCLRRFGIKLGLSTIRRILNGLDNPQNRYRSIHIAGTNGKGSVAAALAAILFSAGYRVGMYTSPHLVRFNERICVDNQAVSDENIISAYEAVKSVDPGDREPTFFEFATAMALYEFTRHNVDWAIIETGMGGRLDATNIIQPALSIITNISLEHKAYLGNTISEIAGEKAGIIKAFTPVITGVHQRSAADVIQSIASQCKAPVFQKGRDFKIRKKKDGGFNYTGMFNSWKNLRIALAGPHQIDNASLVAAACEVIDRQYATIPSEAVSNGLLSTRWPGRLEHVMSRPLVILDGAHNLMAARNLGKYLFEHLFGRNKTLIVGMLDDKPYATMCKDLAAPCDRVVVTQPNIDRALPAKVLYNVVKPLVPDTTIIKNVGEAVMHTIKSAAPQDAICVAGSLYVVGEAKQALETHMGIVS